MMSVCPVCGKYHCIHWPEHWVYRRGETYYCSAMCMDVDIVRDMNILKQVREDRRKRKEAKKMYNKTKKDGTPAKKSGPKPKDGIAQVKVDGALRIETPEADMIEIVEIPESSGHFHNSDRTPPPPPRPKKTETPLIMATVTPEGPKDFGKLIREKRYTVTAISYPDIGEFYYDRKYNSIDWRTIEGDEVSMSPTGWKLLLQDLPEIFETLGVNK